MTAAEVDRAFDRAMVLQRNAMDAAAWANKDKGNADKLVEAVSASGRAAEAWTQWCALARLAISPQENDRPRK